MTKPENGLAPKVPSRSKRRKPWVVPAEGSSYQHGRAKKWRDSPHSVRASTLREAPTCRYVRNAPAFRQFPLSLRVFLVKWSLSFLY